MKIEWVISGTSPFWVEENYQDGGYVYDTYTRKILRTLCDLDVTYIFRGNSDSTIKRIFQLGNYFYKNMTIQFKGEIVFRDTFSTAFAPFDRKRKNVVMLHHLDTSGAKYKSFYSVLTKRFFEKIFLADKVVVVSEYWKNILEKKGYSGSVLIHNAFDLEMFRFNQQELSEFRKKIGIPTNKIIIYLGNARPEKGYLDAFGVLKNINAIFVTTGKNKVNIPVLHKYLSYKDYLKLLKISTLVITMSKFDEGWCRTAHEAMLCGTPVIGSGRGGMKELLKGGDQLTCEYFERLNIVVKNLLGNNKKLEEMSVKGKLFASKFDMQYFKKQWLDLISSF